MVGHDDGDLNRVALNVFKSMLGPLPVPEIECQDLGLKKCITLMHYFPLESALTPGSAKENFLD